MTDEMEGRTRGYEFPVNGIPIAFPDRVFSGREALTRSGHTPASEYQLILVHTGRTHLVGTDDDIDAVEHEGGELRAFSGDRSFTFTVDEVGQVWGSEDMEVDEFERIWPAPDGHHWVLERDDEPDTVLSAGGVLTFVAYEATQIHGGFGYMRETLVERLSRDARLYPIGGGTREVMNEIIAKTEGY